MRSIIVAAALGAVVECLFAVPVFAADICGPKNPIVAHPKDSPPDLQVSGECHVPPNVTYYFGNVNVLNGGRLIFDELSRTIKKTQTDFWTSSIIIENNGALIAGNARQPFGIYGGVLTIHLYGPDQSSGNPDNKPGVGALCKTLVSGDVGPCGIPVSRWGKNGEKADLPGGVTDFFYQYGPLHGDDLCTDGSTWSAKEGCKSAKAQVGYFGYKVLAVSYGGSLQLFGYKGACYSLGCKDPRLTHGSWTRLEGSLAKGDGVSDDKPIVVAGPSNYRPWNLSVSAGDQIVVTTTDYLPGHSEAFVVKNASTGPAGAGGWVEKIWVDHGGSWPHNGERYSLADRLKAAGKRISIDPRLVGDGVETRAAVALLNRSIQIVSGGDKPGDEFPASTPENPCKKLDGQGPCYSFGGHTLIRQGFAKVQVQGVEFRQLGQGGRLAHYPVHFHMARKTPADTFIRDSSVNESMTRWMVLHSTEGVLLAGNVGYKSIGHGYYLEDGTEADNRLYGNIGIFARGAVANDQNPRRVAGILSDNTDPATYPSPNVPSPAFPYRSDSEYPTVFWITNGWNDFQGNMAAGAGTCGACYWLVPAANSDMPDVSGMPMRAGAMSTGAHMEWTGYSALQKDRDFAGSTPLKSFYGNYCSSAMLSFQTTPDAPACDGFVSAEDTKTVLHPTLRDVKSIAPEPARHTVTDPNTGPHTEVDPMADAYYPHVVGARLATQCPLASNQPPNGPPAYDCSSTPVCSNGNIENCSVTVLDHYTSSFNWANGNVSAVWLRPQWYLLDNSALTDVQNGALTFITGGDFTHASVIKGYWALARNSVFVGHTQPQDADHAFASDSGPFNKASGVLCDPLDGKSSGPYCLNSNEAVSLPVTGWFSNQRLFNIYDGPAYQDSNAYLDVNKTPCPNAGYNGGCIYGNGASIGVATDPASPIGPNCYLPNAAIAWKQPNGFFYPPAFHSTNLFFDNVDIRHYVIDPLFKPGTYITDSDAAKKIYCFPNDAMFNGFTGIDRQTELNDDDGSLTGLSNSLPATTPPNPLKQTISVNEDSFFNAPVETPECWSNVGQNSAPVNACVKPSDKQAPVTAKTSPYDYVATVVFHPAETEEKAEIWSTVCTNPSCYGVPLYRQFLTGVKGSNEKSSTREWADWYKNGCDADQNTAKCRWPFIRMSGEALATRETITVNHGAYYLDTTVSRDTQRDEKYNQQGPALSSLTNSFNVFRGAQTYTVFFLYLKPETKQSYQIYVGKGDPNAGSVKAVEVPIATTDLKPVVVGAGAQPWLDVDTSAVASTGLVKVNLDFSKAGASILPTVANGLCQPHTFCKPAGAQCVSGLRDNDPRVLADPDLKKEANAVCGHWAVKDLDCPEAGCLGFQFTLPGNFTADATVTNPSPHRPTPLSFPAAAKNDPNWPQFTRTNAQPDSGKVSDPRTPFDVRSCYYSRLPTASDPGPDQCTVP